MAEQIFKSDDNDTLLTRFGGPVDLQAIYGSRICYQLHSGGKYLAIPEKEAVQVAMKILEDFLSRTQKGR